MRYDQLEHAVLGSPEPVAYWAHVGGLLFGAAFGMLAGGLKEAAQEYGAEDAQGLLVRGASELAAARYAELVANDPSDPELRLARAKALSDQRGGREEAATELEEAIRLFLAAERKPEAVSALEDYRRTTGGFPPDARLVLQLASMAESSGVRDTAVRTYIALAQDHPDTPQAEKALFRLAHVYLAAGMQTEADGTWRVFAERFPRSGFVEHADARFRGAGPAAGPTTGPAAGPDATPVPIEIPPVAEEPSAETGWTF